MKYSNTIDEIINKKNNDNFIKIKLGKSEKIFNYHIDIRLFETLLKNVKNYIPNPQYKKYNKYYDSDNVLIINDNGYEIYYTNIDESICDHILPNHANIQLNICTYRKLNSNDFDIKYNYDKILNIESIYFNQDEYMIEFNKIKNDDTYYEINIVIKKKSLNINQLLKIIFNH